MLEALEYYQSLAQKFPSRVLIGPGIVIVIIGLCIWLAGLRWKMIIGALAGATITAGGVFFAGNYPANVVAGATIVGLVAGVIVNRIVLGIFGALAGAVIVILFLTAGPTEAESKEPMVEFIESNRNYNPDDVRAEDFVSNSSYPTWPDYEIESIPIPVSAAMEITVKSLGYYTSRAKATIGSAGLIGFGGAAAAVIIAIAAVLIIPRVFIAVVSSSLGSAIIFIGMIMLLFYKNSRPLTHITDKPQFYGLAFCGMVIFGSIIQLILSPSIKPVPADGEKGEK